MAQQRQVHCYVRIDPSLSYIRVLRQVASTVGLGRGNCEDFPHLRVHSNTRGLGLNYV